MFHNKNKKIMKNKYLFFALFSVLTLIVSEGVSRAQSYQSDYENMSRSERKQRMEELLYFDVNDMSISTDSARFIKRDLQLFGEMREKRNTRMLVWGVVGMSAGACLAGGAAGAGEPVLAAVCGVGAAAGWVVMMVGMLDTKHEKLLDKARLMSDASLPLMQYDNLALGVSVFHNNVDRSTAFGPSMSIRF